jgi:hypothetical protein
MITTCVICSHTFTARRSTARYCSARCRQTSHRRNGTHGMNMECGAANVRLTASPADPIADAEIQPPLPTLPLPAGTKRRPCAPSAFQIACFHLVPDKHWPDMWRILRQAARRRRIRGRRSAQLSDAILRGRKIADVCANEERSRVALGQEDGGARWLHLRDSRVQSRPACRAAMPMSNTTASRLHSSAMEVREPHERWSSYAWFLRNRRWPR